MIANIERLISSAGFGREEHHKATISMTEAEAAAVYVSKQQMKTGDVFLVCDAGGGTTDINVLKVISAVRGKTDLEPLHWNEDSAIGSTLIDFKVGKILLHRLQAIPGRPETNMDAIFREMIQGKFMSYKCGLGIAALDVPRLALPISLMHPGQNIPHAGVENSNLVLMRYVRPS